MDQPLCSEKPPIVSIVGKSKSGKTTLIEKLIKSLIGRGYRVATIKHDAHSFEVDHPGKDTWRHREAGAAAVIITSSNRLFMTENIDGPYSLDKIRKIYLQRDYDIIITEGFRRDNAPKIEVHRSARSPELVYQPEEKSVIAIASDTNWPDIPIPIFDLNAS